MSEIDTAAGRNRALNECDTSTTLGKRNKKFSPSAMGWERFRISNENSRF